jgi:hypothetical protein
VLINASETTPISMSISNTNQFNHTQPAAHHLPSHLIFLPLLFLTFTFSSTRRPNLPSRKLILSIDRPWFRDSHPIGSRSSRVVSYSVVTHRISFFITTIPPLPGNAQRSRPSVAQSPSHPFINPSLPSVPSPVSVYCTVHTSVHTQTSRPSTLVLINLRLPTNGNLLRRLIYSTFLLSPSLSYHRFIA